jgi:hypothetical protein
MAVDPLAKQISIGFEGGSISGTRALLQALFGPTLTNPATGTSTSVSREPHPRVRVIGGGITNVQGSTTTLIKYPSGSSNGGAGGEPIRFVIGGEEWRARLTGSHAKFNEFLEAGNWSGSQTILWKSEKGKPYGPFIATPPVNTNSN